MEDPDALVGRDRLAARLPEPIETDEEVALADEMLSDASAEARLHGNPLWTRESVPKGVINIVLQAAARGFMNPAGFRDEAADSARFSRAPEYAIGAKFTPAEERAVKGFAQRTGIQTARITKPNHWEARSDLGRGPTSYAPMSRASEKWFPWAAGMQWPQEGRVY